MKTQLLLLTFFMSGLLYQTYANAHARLVSPAPRNNNAGIKTGPCGGLARTNNPTLVQGGQMLTVTWIETINHPGRFLFSLSYANDQGFQQNLLATIPDNQDNNVVPHNYSTQIMIPNVNCDTCTLQMIQSMEENPQAPSFYFSCADIRIVANPGAPPAPMPPTSPPTTPPTGAPNSPIDSNVSTSSSSNDGVGKSSKFGGCGIIKANDSSTLINILFSLFWTLIPLAFLLKIRDLYFISKKI
jgi:hypothetical protein